MPIDHKESKIKALKHVHVKIALHPTKHAIESIHASTQPVEDGPMGGAAPAEADTSPTDYSPLDAKTKREAVIRLLKKRMVDSAGQGYIGWRVW